MRASGAARLATADRLEPVAHLPSILVLSRLLPGRTGKSHAALNQHSLDQDKKTPQIVPVQRAHLPDELTVYGQAGTPPLCCRRLLPQARF